LIHLKIGKLEISQQKFLFMNTLTNFALKEEYKHLQSVGDKVVEICFILDWKFFCIIFKSIYFSKTVFWDRHEAEVVIIFKYFLQRLHDPSDFEPEKRFIDRIYFRNFFGFSDNISERAKVWSFIKIIINKCDEEKK
jgi:IS5 family transposase